MKYVTFSVKFRRLTKSIAVSFLIVLFAMAGTAFTSGAPELDKKIAGNDSLSTDKSSFKSLFTVTYFDPVKPYLTQLNPKAIPFVQSYVKSMGPTLEKMKFWGKPYFNMYDGILAKYKLPKELKYLSVIESSLLPNVVSSAGAVGPWQIMEDEARRMGLTVNETLDERTNFSRSTFAASKILKELFAEFKDWLLVIAAYNCGGGRMRQAIRRSGSKNFWDLQYYLPEETRNHVKRFIGTHYIFEGGGGLTTMTADEISSFETSAKLASDENIGIPTKLILLTGKYRSNIICNHLGMESTLFNKLNPDFNKLITISNYNLRLPVEKMDLFLAKKSAILNESVSSILNY